MAGAEAEITFEIRMFEASVGYAKYSRPGIVSRILADGSAIIYLLSTKHYSDPSQTFCINAAHPDFPATGLDATSFTIYPLARIGQLNFKERRGALVGDLAKEFQAWLD